MTPIWFLDTFSFSVDAPVWLWVSGGLIVLGIIFLYVTRGKGRGGPA